MTKQEFTKAVNSLTSLTPKAKAKLMTKYGHAPTMFAMKMRLNRI